MTPALRLAIPLSLLAALLTACTPGTDKAGTRPDAASAVAERLDADLGRVRAAVEKLAADIAALYPDLAAHAAKADPSRYGFAPNGAYHKLHDDGGPALWISAAQPITPDLIAVAHATEAIDAELMRVCREVPGVNQAYYNDRHSLNRIYPWFDTIAQYPPRMVIPDFNFYYLADAARNPARKAVWVEEPYVDPAGRGWMISSIAPVYHGNVLEGVPGLDVTIADLVEHYMPAPDVPLAVIARNGALVAATDSAIQLLQMPPLRDHKYLETVKMDTYQPHEYNILLSARRGVRALAGAVVTGHAGRVDTELAGTACTVLAVRMKEVDWVVLEFRPRG